MRKMKPRSLGKMGYNKEPALNTTHSAEKPAVKIAQSEYTSDISSNTALPPQVADSSMLRRRKQMSSGKVPE